MLRYVATMAIGLSLPAGALAQEAAPAPFVTHCTASPFQKGYEAKDSVLFLICDEGYYGLLTTQRPGKDLFNGKLEPILAKDRESKRLPRTVAATVYLGKFPPPARVNCLGRAKSFDDPEPTLECVSE